ncbi:MAG: hypothetical protein Q8T08_05770, partial [Ignavibacteria bacterium]|nr:hypothetical protein [Ignavibacteria bacterium]
MLDLVSDVLITDDEETEIMSWQNIFGMTKEQIEEITNPVLQEVLNAKMNEFTEDERISPEEEQSIVELAKNLRATLNVTPETQNQIDSMKALWNIENGDLPPLEVEIILQKSEFCVFTKAVDYLEKRKITTGYNYGGPSFRLKIAKGIYYRAGNVRGSRQTEDILTKIDSGRFYITNKRVLFYGTLGNKTIRYNQIIDFEVYSDGLRISKATGKDAVFSFDNETQLAGAYLARCISENS